MRVRENWRVYGLFQNLANSFGRERRDIDINYHLRELLTFMERGGD